MGDFFMFYILRVSGIIWRQTLWDIKGHELTVAEKYQLLLICLTLSSRKDLSIAPCFIGGFSFHMQGISRGEIL